MIKKLILSLAALGIVASATACNTVKGLGRDVESVGEAGDEAERGERENELLDHGAVSLSFTMPRCAAIGLKTPAAVLGSFGPRAAAEGGAR